MLNKVECLPPTGSDPSLVYIEDVKPKKNGPQTISMSALKRVESLLSAGYPIQVE